MSTYQGSISLAKVKDGEGGTPGTNTATVYLYQRATSVPQKPSGDLTYTFSTGVVSGSALGNWKQNIAELTGTNPIYFILALASSTEGTDTIKSGDWKGPSVLAQDGQDGQNGRGVYSVDMKFINWATNTEAQKPTTSTSGWSESVPIYNSSKPYYYVWVRTNYNDNSTPTDEIYLDNGLSDANKNAATANSISQAAEENAQGAMSIASNTQQHFWWIGQDYSTAIPAGAYMTQVSQDSFKSDPTGKPNLLLRSDSVNLRWGNRIDAQLISTGLKVAKGGLQGGTIGQSDGVYLSTENYGSNITINGHQASNWKEIVGNKFGVDADGVLYATGATIAGHLNAASLTINSDTAITDDSGKITNSTVYGAMSNFTILWNYSTFTTVNDGEGYICKYDPIIGTKSNASGSVLWNGVKRTITKQGINPNTILPYNIPIYVVGRLGTLEEPDSNATTATNCMVWYNSGWKYAIMPTPTAVGGDWTWNEATDIILGKFVEPGSELAFTECEIYNPPHSAKQITSNVTTPTSYITDIDSNNGITIKPKNRDGNDYILINSAEISMWRNDNRMMALSDSTLTFLNNSGGTLATFGSSINLASNQASVIIGDVGAYHTVLTKSGMYFRNGANTTNTNLLTITSNAIKLYKSNTGTATVTLDSSGKLTASSVDLTGKITATSGSFKNIVIKDDNDATVASVTTNGMVFYKAGSKRLATTANGIDVFGSDGSSKVASFGSTISLGQTSTNHLNISSKGLQIYGSNGSNEIASFLVNDSNMSLHERFEPMKHLTISSGATTTTTYSLRYNISGVTSIVFKYGKYRSTQWDIHYSGDGTIVTLTPSSTSANLVIDGSTVGTIKYSSSGKSLTLTVTGKKAEEIYISDVVITYQTDANDISSVVFGSYPTATNQLLKVGNGTSTSSKSDAFKLDWAGNLDISGSLIVEGHDSPIGAWFEIRNTESHAITSSIVGNLNTSSGIVSITLSKGVWLLTGYIQFPNNTTGARGITIAQTQGGGGANIITDSVRSGYPTIITYTQIRRITSNTMTLWLNGWQNSGTTLTIGAGLGIITGVRIA